ncbi:MAG: ABC transporter permease [Pseudomonadota bacterium]
MTSTAAPLVEPSPTRWSKGRRIVAAVLSAVATPLLAVGVLLLAWEGAARFFDVPVWLLPKPSDFLVRIVVDWQLLAQNAAATSLTILMGFAIGVLVAVPLALALVVVPALERGLYPVIVFLNVMPKTVIGPILIVWFGISPMVSVLIVFLMCFFPVLVDAMSGFRAVDPRLHHITRSMGASGWQTFRYIQLPAAMPSIYAGMRIGIIKAIEGVIIAEFIASNAGLGFLIMRASSFMDMPLMFSGLIVTAVVALLFNGALTLFGRLLMPWAFASGRA